MRVPNHHFLWQRVAGLAIVCIGLFHSCEAKDVPTMTHGPILGKPTSSSMVVWARTSEPTEFEVRYGESLIHLSHSAKSAMTTWEHDCTGVAELKDLASNARYHYQVFVNGLPQGLPGSFKTFPDSANAKCGIQSARPIQLSLRIRILFESESRARYWSFSAVVSNNER